MLRCTVRAKTTSGDVMSGSYVTSNPSVKQLQDRPVTTAQNRNIRNPRRSCHPPMTICSFDIQSILCGRSQSQPRLCRPVTTNQSHFPLMPLAPLARSPLLHPLLTRLHPIFGEQFKLLDISHLCSCTVDRYCSPSKPLLPSRHPLLSLIPLFLSDTVCSLL